MRKPFCYGLLAALVLAGAAGRAMAQPKTNVGNSLMDFQVSVVTKDGTQKASAPIAVRRNELVKVVIEGKIKNKKYHTYTATLTPEMGPRDNPPVTLTFAEPKGFVLNGAIHEPPDPKDLPKILGALNGKKEVLRIHKAPFVWEQQVFVSDRAEPGPIKMPIRLEGEVCDEGRCFGFNVPTQLEFVVSTDSPLPFDAASLKPREQVPLPVVGTVAAPAAAKKTENKEIIYGQISSSQDDYKKTMEEFSNPDRVINDKIQTPSDASDLWAFILGGMFWGAISLVTPCVFPMIPITVSIFLKQSEKEHHRPILMASVYSGTIIIVLTLAAALLLKVFREMSVDPFMNYGLGGLFIFFSLSLFGMYEIELPSGLARFTSAHESKGGIIGTMFMALTFTIISFACVAPFLGGFGGTAAAVARPMWVLLLGALAFATTFAAPFFFLALFPTLLRQLPKSGAWLNSVKVVMGFLELAAAVKFCRSAELTLTGGEPWLITFDFALGIYVTLAILAGLYLLGVYRLPHDTPVDHLSVPRLAFAGMFIALGLYLAPALMKNPDGDNIRPRGSIYSWVEAFLLPEAYDSPNDEVHTPSLAAAVERSKLRGDRPQRIFVDFTGLNCTNCRINEKSVFSKRYVRELMEPYLIVKLYADAIPLQYYSPAIRTSLTNARQKADAAANLAFERTIFNNEQLPLYAILEPQTDGTIKVVSVYDEGRINNEAAFAEFLRNPK